MFSKSKKKEKKESSTSGSSSRYHEATTVSNNGTTITRQISSETRQVQGFIREERSYALTHSNSAGNFPPTILGTNRLSLAISGSDTGLSGSRLFGAGSTGSDTFPALQRDAIPFTATNFGATTRLPARTTGSEIQQSSGLPRTSLNSTTYRSPYFQNYAGSYPLRTREPVLQTISTQNAAQNQRIAQSVPANPAMTSHIVPTYENKSIKLGKALIINNIKFMEKKDERLGAQKDSDDLKRLLKRIGFEVETKMDMKGKDMSKKVKDFSQSNFSSHSISLVVIMSHGNNKTTEGKSIRGGFTQIAGIDNVPVLSDDIIELFTATKSHSSLKGKPKIFIFQCCRGDGDQEVCHDATPTRKQTKDYADILIAFSTLPGYLSNRNPTTGSWYIQSLCDVFDRHHRAFHVEELLKIVDDQLSNKHPQYTQTSTYESRGFRRCFLYKNTN